MYYKVSPVVIGIIVVVIVAMAGFCVKIMIDQKNPSGKDSEILASEIVPVLDLSTNTEKENQESVTITARASTEDEAGIDFITSPDGSITRSDKVMYEVKKNGNYTFKVKAKNGQTSSLTIEINNIIQGASSTTPYMPTGFSYLEGEVENGYVIQDQYGNEFVWVPVEDGKLTRNTMLDGDYEESSSTATALVNSVAQNYGFYIAKYEASAAEVDGKKVASSIRNKSPWVNVTYAEAAEAAINASTAFGYEDYRTAIMNSYAWDTVLNWIDASFENYSTNTSYGNYSGNARNTGTTESDIKNNICDLAGNVREWTTEIYKANSNQQNTTNTKNEVMSETINYRVVRGGGASLSRTASSHTGYKENMTDEYWGFRIILYK